MTTPLPSIHLLSGGAAYGLVSKLEARFAADCGYRIAGTFGAVGMMRDELLGGASCDLLILTAALMAQLEASGHVVAGSVRALGTVKTAVAVKSGETPPAVGTPEELRTALCSATGIYFPDPVKATAGIHFMNILKQFGLDAELSERLRPYPNGATAMGEMARSTESGLIGCTQVTEILSTPGVQLVANLPKACELATVYSAGLSRSAVSPQAAAALIALLASPENAPLRSAAGFEG